MFCLRVEHAYGDKIAFLVPADAGFFVDDEVGEGEEKYTIVYEFPKGFNGDCEASLDGALPSESLEDVIDKLSQNFWERHFGLEDTSSCYKKHVFAFLYDGEIRMIRRNARGSGFSVEHPAWESIHEFAEAPYVPGTIRRIIQEVDIWALHEFQMTGEVVSIEQRAEYAVDFLNESGMKYVVAHICDQYPGIKPVYPKEF